VRISAERDLVEHGRIHASPRTWRRRTRRSHGGPSLKFEKDGRVKNEADALARATAGEPLDVYDNRTKLWALLAASAAFVAIGVVMYDQGQQIKGALATGFFFIAGIAIALRLIDSAKPSVRFDADGLTIRRFGRSPVRLAWSDLHSAYPAAIRSQTFVCLAPRDPARMLASVPPAARAVMRANIALVGAPYVLPTAMSLNVNDLLRVVYAYAPALAAEPPDRTMR